MILALLVRGEHLKFEHFLDLVHIVMDEIKNHDSDELYETNIENYPGSIGTSIDCYIETLFIFHVFRITNMIGAAILTGQLIVSLQKLTLYGRPQVDLYGAGSRYVFSRIRLGHTMFESSPVIRISVPKISTDDPENGNIELDLDLSSKWKRPAIFNISYHALLFWTLNIHFLDHHSYFARSRTIGIGQLKLSSLGLDNLMTQFKEPNAINMKRYL